MASAAESQCSPGAVPAEHAVHGPEHVGARVIPASSDPSQLSEDPPRLSATLAQHAGARARTPDDGDLTGRELDGRYRILDRLGQGGMGVVYVAEHLQLRKHVAIKVIHPHLAADEGLLLRFKREALATGQLEHEHIASAIDFGEFERGGAFMVMPLVRGRSLEVTLDTDGHFEPRRAARIGAQIADALSAAHELGIVHRDLKPDNVLLERRGDGDEAVKVLDFGVASLAGRTDGLGVDARPLTQAGTILGTPGYMSPEQATAGDVDHRSDLYALGVILWELCRGERLFTGKEITQIFAAQFKSPPPALELGREPPERELSELVVRLLAWSKDERPSSAVEVRDCLRRIAAAPATSSAGPSLPVLCLTGPYARHLGAVLGALLLLLVFAVHDSGDKATLTAEAIPDTDARAARSAIAASGMTEAASPRAVAAVLPKEPPASALPQKGSPALQRERAETNEAFEAARAALFEGRNRRERRAAAERVVRTDKATPRYLQLVAELELSDNCAERKAALAQMRALDDPRVLPALERLAEQPRRGCGLIKLRDCLACMRRDLDLTIGALKPPEAQ